jgi:hypothetical protein
VGGKAFVTDRPRENSVLRSRKFEIRNSALETFDWFTIFPLTRLSQTRKNATGSMREGLGTQTHTRNVKLLPNHQPPKT